MVVNRHQAGAEVAVMSSETNKDPSEHQDMSRDELEEALNWLENLASKQGKSLAGLTPIESEGEESPFQGLFESDEGELPDWLREMPSDHDRRDSSIERESRLDWLARMASQESIEELPTLEWRQLSAYADVDDEESQVAPEDDLADLFDTPSPSQTTTLELTATEAELFEEADATAPSVEEQDTVAELHVSEELSAADESELDALSESIEAIAELPEAEPQWQNPVTQEIASVETDESVVYPEPDDLDAAMAWLEELAASTEAPVEDLPSVADRALASKLMAEAASGQMAQAASEQSGSGSTTLTETPETANVAESAEAESEAIKESSSRLAAEAVVLASAAVAAETQSETSKEAEEVLPATPVPAPPVARSPEQLLSILDQLAMPQGRSLTAVESRLASVPSGYLISPYSLDSTLEWLSGQSGSSSEMEPSDLLDPNLLAALPDDPDEALRWLESMAEPEEEDGRASEGAAVAYSTADVTEADLLDMPDDPDEAMAWIESLASKSTKKQ